MSQSFGSVTKRIDDALASALPSMLIEDDSTQAELRFLETFRHTTRALPSESQFADALERTALEGDLAALQRILARCSKDQAEASVRANSHAVVRICVQNGHVVLCAWLQGRFDLTLADFCDDRKSAVASAFEYGHFEILAMLCAQGLDDETLAEDKYHSRQTHPLLKNAASYHAPLRVLQLALAMPANKAAGTEVLRHCFYRLKKCRFLSAHFGWADRALDPIDRGNVLDGMRYATESGKTACVKWFIETFRLQSEDFANNRLSASAPAESLEIALIRGHTALYAVWETYFPEIVLRLDLAFVVLYAVNWGMLETLKLLHARGVLSEDVVAHNSCAALRMAVKSGFPAITKWLCEVSPACLACVRDAEANGLLLLAARLGYTETIVYFLDVIPSVSAESVARCSSALDEYDLGMEEDETEPPTYTARVWEWQSAQSQGAWSRLPDDEKDERESPPVKETSE